VSSTSLSDHRGLYLLPLVMFVDHTNVLRTFVNAKESEEETFTAQAPGYALEEESSKGNDRVSQAYSTARRGVGAGRHGDS